MSSSSHVPTTESSEPALADALAGFSRGRASVVRPTQHWYIVSTSEELRKTPVSRMLLGIPLVLFRDDSGTAHALLDRCPHRNVPLSIGRVASGRLECAYHGWQFDGEGTCRHVPSLCGPGEGKGRKTPAFPTRECDGFIWVFANPNVIPTHGPYRFPHLDDPNFVVVREQVEANGTMFSAIENALDVPHTAFLHRGLFRSQSRGIQIDAKVRRTPDRVEVEYVGEPRPEGLVARLLSPSGGTVIHYDRFILPSITQVEYRIGSENHFFVNAAVTPISDFVTRLYAVVLVRMRVNPKWIAPLLKPFALRIFQQDAKILQLQTDNIRRFGGEQFVSTEIDVIGKHIWRLLRAAERGEVLAGDDAIFEETVRLEV